MESPKGWFADPHRRYLRRYYDGENWTNQVQTETGEVVTETSPGIAMSPPDESTPVAPYQSANSAEAPKSKSKKNIVFAALGVVVALVVIGGLVGDDSSSNVSTSEGSSSEGVGSQSSSGDASRDVAEDGDEASGLDVAISESTGESEPSNDGSVALPTSDGGTRDNPVEVGESFLFEISTWGDADESVWELTVLGEGTDITNAVLEENQFNDPPEAGSVFYGVPVRLVLASANKEPLAPWFNITFDMFGPAAMQIYDGMNASCGVVPNKFNTDTEVFVGGAIEGMFCFALPQAEIDSGPMLSVEAADDRLFWSTSGGQPTVAPSEFQGSTFTPDGSGAVGERSNPAPLGTPLDLTLDTFGDADKSVWQITVTGPGSDITDAVLAENQFNDPPQDGYIFFGVPVELTLVEADKEPLAPWLNISFDIFGPASLQIFDGYESSCGTIPNSLEDMTEVFAGGTLAGQICFAIPNEDAEAGPLLSTDQNDLRTYWATN